MGRTAPVPADTQGAARPKASLSRQAVLDAATSLFAERGYSGTNLQHVADSLGMSRAGLYYHFSTKEKILEAMVEEVTLAPVRDYEEAVSAAQSEPEKALRRLIERNCRWVLAHGTLFRVLDRSENDLPEALKRRHNEGKRAILESLIAIIERGIEVGQFRPTDAHVSAFAIIGMCNWIAWWYKPTGRVGEDAVVTAMADNAVRIVLRSDSHRSRSERVEDVLRVLKEDVAHLERLVID